MLDVLESSEQENSFDYFNVQNISFDHPLTSSEIEEFRSIVFSLNNLRQVYFKGTIDVPSIELVKNLMSLGGYVLDGAVEKYIVTILSPNDMNKVLESNYENPETWQIAYDLDDESFVLTDLPSCRSFFAYINRIKTLVEKEALTDFEKVLRVYDIIKTYNFDESCSDSLQLAEIVKNQTAGSKGFNKLFSFVLSQLGINSFVGREKDASQKETYVTIVDIKDDKYGVDGIFLFDPSMDSLPTDIYKSEDIRRINYNYFGLAISDIDYSLCGDMLIGALGIIAIEDYDYSLERKKTNKDNTTSKEFEQLNRCFLLKYSDLFQRIKNSKTIPIDTICTAVNNIYGENDKVDDYERLLKENYEARKEELFSPKTEEILCNLLK